MTKSALEASSVETERYVDFDGRERWSAWYIDRESIDIGDGDTEENAIVDLKTPFEPDDAQ